MFETPALSFWPQVPLWDRWPTRPQSPGAEPPKLRCSQARFVPLSQNCLNCSNLQKIEQRNPTKIVIIYCPILDVKGKISNMANDWMVKTMVFPGFSCKKGPFDQASTIKWNGQPAICGFGSGSCWLKSTCSMTSNNAKQRLSPSSRWSQQPPKKQENWVLVKMLGTRFCQQMIYYKW